MARMISHVSGEDHARDAHLDDFELIGGDILDEFAIGRQEDLH